MSFHQVCNIFIDLYSLIYYLHIFIQLACVFIPLVYFSYFLSEKVRLDWMVLLESVDLPRGVSLKFMDQRVRVKQRWHFM